MKKMLFFVSCFIVMINSVDAVTLTCPEIVSPGELVNCEIKDNEYIGLKAKYKIDKELEYKTLSLSSNWKKYYASLTGFSIGNVNSDEKISMSLNLKILDNAKINQDYYVKLTEVEAVDVNYKYVKLDDLSSKIKVVSNVNTLKSLVVSEHTLSPKFSSDINSYKLTTEKDTVTIKAVPNDELATVSGDVGVKKLQYGSNVFVINVKSVKGEIRKYYIYITRKYKEVEKSNSNTLSNDITLKSLSLSYGKIEFDKSKFLYSVDVDYEVESIEVKAIPTNKKAAVKIEKPDKLEVGKNNISVIVTAEDGTVGRYIVVVNRQEKLEDDATIKNLNISGYTIDFKSDVYEYELEIGNEEKLDIEVELNSDKATYKIIGNKDLKNNSVINIQVKAEDGTINNYKIKIIRQNEKNSNSIFEKIDVIPLAGFVGLVVVVLIVKIIKTRRIALKNKNDDNN